MSLAASVERVLAVARGELGYKEGPRNNETKYGKFYGLDFQPWCAMGVSWCEIKAGGTFAVSTSKGYASVAAGKSWFQRSGLWHPASQAQPGDHGMLYYPKLKRVGHVFLIEDVGAGNVMTIEFNSNAQGSREGLYCIRKKRPLSSLNGVGRPVRVSAPQPGPPASDGGAFRRKIRMKPSLGRHNAAAHPQEVKILQGLLCANATDLVATNLGSRPLSSFCDGTWDSGMESVLATWQDRTGGLSHERGGCGPDTWAWLVGV